MLNLLIIAGYLFSRYIFNIIYFQLNLKFIHIKNKKVFINNWNFTTYLPTTTNNRYITYENGYRRPFIVFSYVVTTHVIKSLRLFIAFFYNYNRCYIKWLFITFFYSYNKWYNRVWNLAYIHCYSVLFKLY